MMNKAPPCNTCGEYIYKGKKFNSRKETVMNENYLGLHIFRFYIKCPRCVAEIAFKTDPENTDYALEAGATRNFEAAKTAEALAKKAQQEKEEEELNNPMKVLENRTKQSRNEMERIENLEELRELNSRHAKVDHESMIKLHAAYEEQLKRLQDEEDEAIISQAFGNQRVKRLADSDSDNEGDDDSNQQTRSQSKVFKAAPGEKATDILVKTSDPVSSANSATASSSSANQQSSAPVTSSKPSSRDPIVARPKSSALAGIVVVKKKKPTDLTSKDTNDLKSTNAKTVSDSTSNNSNSSTSDTKLTDTNSQTQNSNIVPAKVSSNNSTNVVPNKPAVATGALSMLGNYSESDESDSS